MKIPERHPHKASGQDRCRYQGKDFYFGKTGSPESDERYKLWVAALLAGKPLGPVVNCNLKINDLVSRFLVYAKERHNGNGEYYNLKQACVAVLKVHRHTPCSGFGTKALLEVRAGMIDSGWPRQRINDQISRVRRMFKWGVQNELVHVHTSLALREIFPLRPGECPNESTPVRPATDEQIATVLPELPTLVADMVRVHRLIGCRPTEMCMMRPCDIDRSSDIWIYTPRKSKNQWRGIKTTYAIGPKAQAILKTRMPAEEQFHIFSPSDSIDEHNAARAANRKTKASPSHNAKRGKSKRKTNKRYSHGTYRNAIYNACMRLADGDKDSMKEFYFSPNRLRHAKATELRSKYGIEQARIALAHTDVATTLLYAERDLEQAKAIARATG